MRTLANELAPHSIRVNSMHPTGVNTPMVMNAYSFRAVLPLDVENPTVDDFALRLAGRCTRLPTPWVEAGRHRERCGVPVLG